MFPLMAAGATLPQGVSRSRLIRNSGADRGISPEEVKAAFESILKAPGGRTPVRSGAAPLRPAARRVHPASVELAAVLGTEESAIFTANLTDSVQRALTPPSVSVVPGSLTLSPPPSGTTSTRHTLQISALSGTVNWVAAVRLFDGKGWITLSPSSGSAGTASDGGGNFTVSSSTEAAVSAPLTVEINYGALASPGLYQALIVVVDKDTGYRVDVPVTVEIGAAQGKLLLSHSSFVFTVAGGGSAPPSQTLAIGNAIEGNLSWSIPDSAVPAWLNLSPLAGTAGYGRSLASFVTLSLNNANALALASGVYQALLPVSAPGARNDPQLIMVTLQRLPAATPASAAITPSGLVFVATQGGGIPAGRTVIMANAGGGILTGNFNITTSPAGNWLSMSPSGGTTSSGPLPMQVSVTPTGLSAGKYRGAIRGTFSFGPPQDVDVLLIVRPPEAQPRTLSGSQPAVDSCAPLELLATTIGNGATIPTSFPQVLVVSVIDSCGNPVSDATVVASAEGSPIVLQPTGDGAYNGTWVPRQQGSIPVSFTVLHPNFPTATRSYAVSTAASASGAQLPVLGIDGVVEGAGFTPRRPLPQGGIVSLFGERLATKEAHASQIPLERTLAGTSVRVGNQQAPLFDVLNGQVNAQMPFEAKPGTAVSITVSVNGLFTAPQSYLVGPALPGIFITGSGGPAILDVQNRLITSQNPAHIGDVLQIFATGLGATDPPVESGKALPGGSTVTNPVTVTIGGVDLRPDYQGLAPGFVGLYQVNVLLVPGVPTGDAVAIVLQQNGIPGNSILPATIPIR